MRAEGLKRVDVEQDGTDYLGGKSLMEQHVLTAVYLPQRHGISHLTTTGQGLHGELERNSQNHFIAHGLDKSLTLFH